MTDNADKIQKLAAKLDHIQHLLVSLKNEGVMIEQDILQAIDAQKQAVVKQYINQLND
jgi:hypothetical protein